MMYFRQFRPAIAGTIAVALAMSVQAQAQNVQDILEQAARASNSVDITDKILTNTSPDCAQFDATYTSEITDLQQRRQFDGAVIVSADETACTVLSNSIPNHDVGGGSDRNFATPMAQIGSEFLISRSPQIAASSSVLTHQRFDAILLNGVVVHILSAGCYDPNGRRPNRDGNVLAGCPSDHPWLIDPMSPLAPFAEDEHHGHTQPDGRYHYHGNPMALFDNTPGPNGSPVIGFAADGFPIFGSYFRDADGNMRKARSGYTLRSGNRPGGDGNPGGAYDGLYRADYEFTGGGDLDACNGMTVNGTYGYYVTDTYPWVIACLSGTPDPSFNRRRR
ncbi:MAG: YHYH protein [Alphaproteobacteria bacterium]|nr:YHYH protein [Alphaproteobacteria bacterium]